MPGSSLSPKDSEKHPIKTSWSCWSHRNCASSGFLGSGKEESRVSGYSPIWVLAQGQKPSQSPWQTNLIKGWFGCDSRSSSKCLMKIGVTMAKRWGFLLIVFVTMGFANSDLGIAGSAEAVSVQSAEEWEKCSPLSHMLYLRYLGQISCARAFFDITRFLSMAHLLASFAGMSETAVLGEFLQPLKELKWLQISVFGEVFTIPHEFQRIPSGMLEFHGILMESRWLEPQPFWFPMPLKFQWNLTESSRNGQNPGASQNSFHWNPLEF